MVDCCCATYYRPHTFNDQVQYNIEIGSIDYFRALFDEGNIVKMNGLANLRLGQSQRTVLEYTVFLGTSELLSYFLENDGITKLNQDIVALKTAVGVGNRPNMDFIFVNYCKNKGIDPDDYPEPPVRNTSCCVLQ